tara:strand:- start:5132 stop:6229 length:1098 start_codon:yes stop_codon:yes gene_type:complete
LITIKVNGVELSGFESSSVSSSMETASSSFTFNATAQPDSSYPIKAGDSVTVDIDGTTRVTGFVDKVVVSYDSGSHTISISGRDKLADLIDSTVGDTKQIVAPISFTSVCRLILDGIGLTDVKVINNITGIEDFKEGELVSASVGEKAFQFLEKFARVRQALLTTDGLGNLVIERGSSKKLKTQLINIPNNQLSNISQGSSTVDISNRYNKYSCAGDQNISSGLSEEAFADVSAQGGDAVDSDIRTSRVLEFNSEENATSETCANRAAWEANVRRARSITASITVPGNSANNELWIPNRLVDINDVFLNINAQMLIKSVTYSSTLSGGSTTKLELISPDAYSLEASQSSLSKKRNDLSDEFLASV